MIKIAHRGNTQGPNPEKENSPAYILDSIDKGFDCEIDLWRINNSLFLGHDGPEYEINEAFLFGSTSKLWIHCKNLDALHFSLEHRDVFNSFWHQNDAHTLTSHGYIWTYPGQAITSKSILVDLKPEALSRVKLGLFGLCADYLQ